MKNIYLIAVMILTASSDYAQTVYVPSGTGGIGSSTNSSVGIGTSTPASRLDVAGPGGGSIDFRVNGRMLTGDGSNVGGVFVNSAGTMFLGQFDATRIGFYNNLAWRMVIDNAGNIGVGTTTPQPGARLDVQGGALRVGGATGNADAALHVSSSTSPFDRLTQLQPAPGVSNKPGLNIVANTDATATNQWWAWGVLTTGQYAIQPSYVFGGQSGLFIERDGDIGIGTSTPGSYKLAVEGKIGAREVNVTAASPWPDYVFDPAHKLPSLEIIERYIQQYKHLPEIPTAREVEEKGVDLGQMNAILLKKVEELTLYVIDQQKQIDAMKAKIK
jgi:hypothetical protein